ncbi:MAG: universal stress protein [Methanomicrobiales archaeon]|nr:universal stress protein [Methanomicrobiales archaeon]
MIAVSGAVQEQTKILVLLDGSTWSHKGALHAVQVARKSGSKVIFFSVLDRNEARAQAFTFCTQSDMCHLVKEHEERIWRDMKRSITGEYQDLITHAVKENVDCESRTVEREIREEVLREANTGGYALVVMGAYGKGGKTHAGMLSEQIAGLVDPPLLIVR